jgi:hypothetical protein
MTNADDAMREALQQRGAASTAGRPAPDTSELDARARREERAATSAAQDARAAAQAAAAEFDRIAGQAPQPPIVIPPTGETITPGDARPTPALLTTLLGMVRVDAQGEPIEIDLQDPESIRGANLDELVAAARALGWVEGDPAKAGGGGFRFFKPGTNNSQGIRLMFGDPKAPAGSGKQDPYALITRPGAKGNEKVRVPLEGNPEVENQGGPGTYASGRVPPPEPAPVRVPGEGPVDPEPVQPVEPVEPVEPIEPIGPEDLIP